MTRTLPDKLIPHPLSGKQEKSLTKDLLRAPTGRDSDAFYTLEDEAYYVKPTGLIGSIFESMTTSLYHAFLGAQSPEGILLTNESTPPKFFFGSKFAQDYVFIQGNIEKFHPACSSLRLLKFEKIVLVSHLLHEGDFYGNGNTGSIPVPNNPDARLAFRIDFGQTFQEEPNDLLFTASSFFEIIQNLSRDFRLFPSMATYQGVLEALEEIAGIDQSMLEKIFTDHFLLMEKAVIEIEQQEIAVAEEIDLKNQPLQVEIDQLGLVIHQLSSLLETLKSQLNPVFFDEDAIQPERTEEEQAHLDQYIQYYELYTQYYDLQTQKIVERNKQSEEIMKERLGYTIYSAHRSRSTFEERLRHRDTFILQLNKLPELIRALQQESCIFTEDELAVLTQHQNLLEQILPAFELIQRHIAPLQPNYAYTQSRKLILALIKKDLCAEEIFTGHLENLEDLFLSEKQSLDRLEKELPYQVNDPEGHDATKEKIELQSAIVEYNQLCQKIITDAREAIGAKKSALMNRGNHSSALFSGSNQTTSTSNQFEHQ